MPSLNHTANLEILIPILRSHAAFAELTDEEIIRFADAAEFRFAKQGTRLIEQGEPGDEFFVVMSGQLRAIDMLYDPPHLLNYHDAGHIIGVRALLTNEPRAATVEVVIDATVAVYDRSTWERLIRRQPQVETYFQDMEREFEQRSLGEFPGRQWDEVVVASTKRHILAFMARLSLPLSMLLVPIMLLIGVELMQIKLTFTDANLVLGSVIAFFFLVAGLLGLYHYVDWRNDDFILTTKRFIHIERKLLYGEQWDEAPLTRIQDVSLSSPGFLNRFDYHNLRIKTAGAGEIRINGITKARQMTEWIFREKGRAIARVGAADIASVRQQLAQELDWQETLEKPILAIAEEQGGISTPRQTYRLPSMLNYFVPRLQDVQADGATIVWRKHYWVLLQAVGLPALSCLVCLCLLLASLFSWLSFAAPADWIAPVLFGLLLAASLFWYLWYYDGWRRDIYQVSEDRILDVTSSPFGLGGERTSEGNLENIQNITYNIPNFLNSLLNMGSVVIETAGTGQTFNFKQVYNPSGVQQEIFNRMVWIQQKQRTQRQDTTTRDMIRAFAEYQYLFEKANAKGLIKLGGEQGGKPEGSV
jgi:membrane protein YdbS with pleckstrin-like domain